MTPDPHTLGRKLWIALAVVAGVVAVVLSWRVPEPESNGTDPGRSLEKMSYLHFTPQQVTPMQGPPPNYGGR